MRVLGFIDRLFDKKISSKGLGVFRICFSTVLFFDVSRIFRYRQLYFDPIPFIEEASIDFTTLLIIWMITLLMLVFGIFTRIMTVVNYLCVIWILNIVGAFEYHMDYTYIGVSFLMMFIPLSKSYSIDSLFVKLRYSRTHYFSKLEDKTSVLNYFIIVFIGVAFIYFGSVFFKFNSIAWKNGLGLWLPASIPPFLINDYQWLLNQEWLIKFLGYFTFLFEIIFPFIFFNKRFRPYLFFVGVTLHIGIFFLFPIPCFALGYIAIYLLMIPVSFWDKLAKKIQFKTEKLQIFYNQECLLSIRTKILISHFDVLNSIHFKPTQKFPQVGNTLDGFPENELLNNIYSVGINGKVNSGIETCKKVSTLVPLFYPLAILFYIPGVSYIINRMYSYMTKNRSVKRYTVESYETQIKNQYINTKYRIKYLIVFKAALVLLVFFEVISIPSKSVFKTIYSTGFLGAEAIENISSVKYKLNRFSSIYLGIMSHGVFVDGHYIGYDKLFTIRYKEHFLPLFDNEGMVDTYLKAGIWADFGFRVNMPFVLENTDKLKRGLPRYAAFWAFKNGIELNDVEFTILMKPLRANFEWERDLLKNNLESPWEEVGKITWKENSAEVELIDLN